MNIVIIGAGLAGLECGYMLAKVGNHVTVLEQSNIIGGCLQTFKRRGQKFDTGFHYIGGLDEGQHLWKIFKYFDLLDLPWKRMDDDCFDEVIIGDKHYKFASGHQQFAKQMGDYFPNSRAEIETYTNFLKQVGDNIFHGDELRSQLIEQSAYEFLNKTISDPELRKVLSGASTKMELNPETLPLYTFAQINDSYLRGAYRLQGGGSQIAEHLANSIKAMGGEVIASAKVTELEDNEGKIAKITVKYKNGEIDCIENPDYVISTIHPASTAMLVGKSQKMRPVYKRRLQRLENTVGMFTANLSLKDGKIPYINHNLFIHSKNASPWQTEHEKLHSMMVHCNVPEEGDYAQQMDLLCPMPWNLLEKWVVDGKVETDEEYRALKEEWLEKCIDFVKEDVPGLKEAVAEAYTSTPLTYLRYTGIPQGSAFGIRKDYRNVIGTIISNHTPIENLMLAGQNLALHGVLGVSMSAISTVSNLLQKNVLLTIDC